MKRDYIHTVSKMCFQHFLMIKTLHIVLLSFRHFVSRKRKKLAQLKVI